MNVDIESVLVELGIDFDVRGNEANGLCPMHYERVGRRDNSPSWWINLETGQHICFSCHYSGGLLHLVCDVKGFFIESWGDLHDPDYTSAKVWLANVAQISPERLAQALTDMPRFAQSYDKPIEMSDARLAVYSDPPLEQLIARNITLESARVYGILWDATTDSWVLPLREPTTSKLMGWQEKGTLNRRFMNRPPGLAKSKTLFGLDVMPDEMTILVESPLDCARIYSAGFHGAVAVCGSLISDAQVKLIRNSDRVISALDNPKVDEAGRKGSADLVSLSLRYGLNLSFFNYGDSGKKDPGDMTDEEIAWGLEHAVSSLYGESAYV